MESIEEKKVGIPESITIGGVTYTVKDTPELQQFIQEVAKVEKSKLYTQFENLKSQIANLGKVKVTGNLDVDTIVDKLKGTFVTKEDFQEMLPGVLKEVVQPVLTATEQNRQEDLRQYREKLISENAATCIPELVKGETKEELDALIQKQAQEMGTQIIPTPTSAPISGGSTAPMPPATPRRTSPEVSGPQNVKQMPMSEFERQRETLKQQLEAMYGGGSL